LNKEFFDKLGGVSYFDTDKRLEIVDLVQGKRNLVIGEPGVGKTRLLEKIRHRLEDDKVSTKLISLRHDNAINLVDELLNPTSELPKALLLDGLDEVKSHLFPSVLQKIERVAERYPDLTMFISVLRRQRHQIHEALAISEGHR
jgi:transcription termination factor Rho